MSSSSFLKGFAGGLSSAALLLYAVRRNWIPASLLDRLFEDPEERLKKELGLASSPSGVEADPSVIEEQFVRNIQFFGEEGQKRVQDSYVVIVGAGGVGSHCAISLARSGVGKLRIIDFDRVTVSSLNRHASATWEDVGTSKVESIKNSVKKFAPFAEVDAVEQLFRLSDAESLLLGGFGGRKPDYVIDCIDNVPSKVDLLAFCHSMDIPVLSSCGSACKADPTRIKICLIEESKEDDLARVVRSKLKQKGIAGGIRIIYSTERSARQLLPLKEFQEEDPSSFQVLENFRIRTLPVIGPLPAVFGNAIAGFVLCVLAGQPMSPLSAEPLNLKQVRKLQEFVRKEVDVHASHKDVEGVVPQDRIEFVFNVLCTQSSAISGQKGGLVVCPWVHEGKGAELKRFLEERGPDENLLLMSLGEAKRHMKEGGSREKNVEIYGETVVQRVEKRLKSTKFVPRKAE